jgi:hypothetical protein
MAEIVNLRRAKKRRQRAEAAHAAEQQRLLHGRTRAEKQLQKLEKSQADRAARGTRLEPDDIG